MEAIDKKTISNKEFFDHIYKTHMWGGQSGFYSGTGSHDEKIILPYIELLKHLIVDNRIERIVEIGCGDFNVMGQVLGYLWAKGYPCDYAGIDVVPDLVSYNESVFSRPGVHFSCADASQPETELPERGMADQHETETGGKPPCKQQQAGDSLAVAELLHGIQGKNVQEGVVGEIDQDDSGPGGKTQWRGMVLLRFLPVCHGLALHVPHQRHEQARAPHTESQQQKRGDGKHERSLGGGFRKHACKETGEACPETPGKIVSVGHTCQGRPFFSSGHPGLDSRPEQALQQAIDRQLQIPEDRIRGIRESGKQKALAKQGYGYAYSRSQALHHRGKAHAAKEKSPSGNLGGDTDATCREQVDSTEIIHQAETGGGDGDVAEKSYQAEYQRLDDVLCAFLHMLVLYPAPPACDKRNHLANKSDFALG